jgi:hypothetical protein
MRITTTIGNIDRSARTLIRGFEITKDLGGRMSTARMNIWLDPNDNAVVGSAKVGTAIVGQAVSPGQDVEVRQYTGPAIGGALFDETLFDQSVFGGATESRSPDIPPA